MKTNIIYLCAIALLCGACGDQSPSPETPVAKLDIPIEPQEEAWVSNGNNFAVDLLSKAIREAAEKEAAKENVMLSPLSLQLALGMLANGATESAYTEIATVTGFSDVSIGEMNSYFHKLSAALTESELDVALALANGIWVQNGFKVKDAFIQTNREVYNAEVSNVNFADPATLDIINSWCDKHTRGTIKEIPLQLSALTRVILANATYFKGDWSTPFEVEDTKPGVFTTSKGEKQTVNMMNITDRQFYASNEQYQAVSLLYGNESFSMTILLPAEESSVDELLDGFDWGAIPWGSYQVELSLPKFKTKCHTDLIGLLQAMGIREIFREDGSALVNIADGIFINQAFQEMYLEVNEKGTEAAAVTVIGMDAFSGPPDETGINIMHVDRPFVFAIRENSSGVILFTGKIGKIEE
jgi:serpin B